MSETQKSGNTVIAVVAAIYMLLLALWTLCGSAGAVLGGSLLGSLSSAGVELGASNSDIAQVQAASGLLAVIGVAFLVLAIAFLVMAVGIFLRKTWSRMGTVIVNGIYVVLGLVSLLSGGFNIINLILMILCGIVAFLFYSNADIKASLTA